MNDRISRLKRSVRYLFEHSLRGRETKAWRLEDFRRAAQACIEARFGEVDARRRAAEFGTRYLRCDDGTRRAVLDMLLAEFGVDPQRAAAEVERFAADQSQPLDERAARLREALRPRRQALLTRFTSLPEGLKFLVDLRAYALRASRSEPRFRVLEAELAELFRYWFDPGFLDIQRITWSSSASLLEKLMQYEANHSIVSWQDLKNRLDVDRRCYTLFHPRLPQEPLAILHVALHRGIATNVQELLDVESELVDPEEADTAVFYSVTSPQEGLRGISFGEIIIKGAVRELRRELPDLETFVTLSPVPGFRKWLGEHLAPEDLSGLPCSAESLDSALEAAARDRDLPWVAALERLLVRKCLQHLITVENGRPINPVARFHLRNGAHIHRINFMGDTSPHGLATAAGMMVNYGYDLKQMEKNLLRLHQGKLPVSGSVLRLARQLGLETAHLEAV